MAMAQDFYLHRSQFANIDDLLDAIQVVLDLFSSTYT